MKICERQRYGLTSMPAQSASHYAIHGEAQLELTVPPNHACKVRMEGRKMRADIPYTARLSCTYVNGETQWTTITGTYDGVQIGEVRAVVDRCEEVVDAKPCPD